MEESHPTLGEFRLFFAKIESQKSSQLEFKWVKKSLVAMRKQRTFECNWTNLSGSGGKIP